MECSIKIGTKNIGYLLAFLDMEKRHRLPSRENGHHIVVSVVRVAR